MNTKKICSKCRKVKTLEEFGSRKSSNDGRRGVCKVCINKSSRVYKKKRYSYKKEELLAKNKLWREANKELVQKADREKYKRNSVSIRRRVKLYSLTDKGALVGTQARQKRKDKIKATSDGTITQKALKELAKRQNNCCFYCYSYLEMLPPIKVHLDHVRPLARGGTHTICNVVWSCQRCNSRKGIQLWHS